MVRIRRSSERGHARRGWLESYHTFSFAEYYDPEHMGYRTLRVINEDWIAPGQGFPTHPHRDMEIVTYVVSGSLAHRDSTGTEEVIRAGEVQRMSAGSGITHSEYNGSRSEPVHLLQIWIHPEREGLKPGYEQNNFPAEEKQGHLRVVASRDGREGSVTIHQDASLSAALLDAGQEVSRPLDAGRHAWVQVVTGAVTLNGQRLEAGDAAAVTDEPALTLRGEATAEVLVFDLA